MLHCDIIQLSLHIDSSLPPNVLELQIKTYTTKTLIYEEMVADFLFVNLSLCSRGVFLDPRLCVCLVVFNATFNNISVVSWRSVLLVEETRGPEENHLELLLGSFHKFICFKRAGNQFLSQLNCEFEPRSWQGVL